MKGYLRFWILDFGFWILDFGFWIFDEGGQGAGRAHAPIAHAKDAKRVPNSRDASPRLRGTPTPGF
jgi:hypothetical protein